MANVILSSTDAGAPVWNALGVIFGALLGSGISWWATSHVLRRTEEKETRAIQVSKLEEAVHRVLVVRKQTDIIVDRAFDWIVKGIPLPDEYPPGEPQLERLIPLISIWAPDCWSQIQRVRETGSKYEGILNAMRRHLYPMNRAEMEKLLPDLQKAREELDAALDDLQFELSVSAVRLVAPTLKKGLRRPFSRPSSTSEQ
jgi:hypothetical protein